MIATLPPYKSRKPLEIMQIGMVLCLLLTPAAIKLHMDHLERTDTANEYSSSRLHLLSEIGVAVAKHDLSTLRQIQSKFAAVTNDREFKSTLNTALAEVSAREAQAELNIAKHLDVARHREESSVGNSPTVAVKTAGDDKFVEKLSVLPR